MLKACHDVERLRHEDEQRDLLGRVIADRVARTLAEVVQRRVGEVHTGPAPSSAPPSPSWAPIPMPCGSTAAR